jgi:hypothetical protein
MMRDKRSSDDPRLLFKNRKRVLAFPILMPLRNKKAESPLERVLPS